MSADTDPEHLAYSQRLKAAVHFTVNNICKEMGEDKECQFSRHMVAVLSETTFRVCQSMTQDLELFAKHAKRSTVNADDVKLMVRATPPVLTYLSEMADNVSKKAEAKKVKRQQGTKSKKQGKGRSVAASVHDNDDADEDSNL